jgi:hypothetical protein
MHLSAQKIVFRRIFEYFIKQTGVKIVTLLTFMGALARRNKKIVVVFPLSVNPDNAEEMLNCPHGRRFMR